MARATDTASKQTPQRIDIDRAAAAAQWYLGLKNTTNEKFFELYFDTHRYLVLKGGGGSGKSVFAARKILERASCEPGHRFLVCRKVGRTLRESCYRLICALISDYYSDTVDKVNKTDLTIRFKSGSEILFAGLDDPDKLKSIYEITDIWIEEAAEIAEADFNQLDIRMRGKSDYYRQMIISFNPVSITHWLKSRFFDTTKPDQLERIRTHESCYLDNRWLSDEDRRTLLTFKDTDEYYYTVYCLGEWGVTGKTVFDAKALSARLREIPSMSEGGGAVKIGDFGYSLWGDVIDSGSIRFDEDKRGKVMIYKDVEERVPYVIGADTAGEGSDYFVAQVLDNRTGEQVAVLRQQTDEDVFVRQLYCLGIYYNAALIGPETNFSSYPVRELQRLKYPRLFVRDAVDTYTREPRREFGFRTDSRTRPLIIAELVKVVREHVELINDYTTISEMLTFIRDEDFKPVAEEGAHDDCVMSLAIAHYLRPYQSYTVKDDKKQFVTWHDSQWEDWRNATPEERRMLISRWGTPKGLQE